MGGLKLLGQLVDRVILITYILLFGFTPIGVFLWYQGEKNNLEYIQLLGKIILFFPASLILILVLFYCKFNYDAIKNKYYS